MDTFEELQDIVLRLKRIAEHSDGVVSIQITAEAWRTFEQKIRLSPSFIATAKFMVADSSARAGKYGQGNKFELMGVEFADYDRVTGLPTNQRK